MMKENKKYDLEGRLIDFAVLIIKIADGLHKTFAGNNLSNQITRSSNSSALHYGEAQSAESKKDFIHKMKVVLKELRETLIGLKIIKKANLYNDIELLEFAMKENNELISIFVKSIETASKQKS